MDDSDTAEVRAAVQMAVIKVCDGGHNDSRLTQRATATLAELTLQYIRCSLVPNLIAFSNHASRRRITEQDVLLTLRNHNEFQQKVFEKLEHVKRTNAVLAAPVMRTKKRQERQDTRLEKPVDPSTDGCESSSSDETNRPLQIKQKTQQHTTKFDENFSSSDDELNAIRSKLARKRPAAPVATKKAPSKKPSFKFFTSPASDAQPSPKAKSPIPNLLQTQSKRVHDIILENQDDDSLPSDCD